MNRSPLPPAFRWLGPPLAAFFCAGASVRRCAYALGLTRAKHATVPVISVGNLTAGGTGKTPAVAYLARELKERGHGPAIVLRGYGAAAPGELNDEGQELARELPDLPIIANPNRAAGAAEAVRRGANVVLLDDGFQHWALARDFDLVLLDASDPFGGGHRLPWGYLRESPAALTRAQAVLITRSDALPPEQLESLRARLAALAPHALLGTARHRPAGLRSLTGGDAPDLFTLRGRSVFAACGLARPELFRSTLKGLGLTIAGARNFPDHHAFTAGDLQTCLAEARVAGAEALVITEKDASKWQNLLNPSTPLPVWVLRIAFGVTDGETELWTALNTVLQKTP